MFDKDLLKNIDKSKCEPIHFNFPEMTETEFEKYRKQGLSDNEICKIANEKKKAA